MAHSNVENTTDKGRVRRGNAKMHPTVSAGLPFWNMAVVLESGIKNIGRLVGPEQDCVLTGGAKGTDTRGGAFFFGMKNMLSGVVLGLGDKGLNMLHITVAKTLVPEQEFTLGRC